MKCLIFSGPGTFPFFVQELLVYRDSINSQPQNSLRCWTGILLDILVADIWIYQILYTTMKRARLTHLGIPLFLKRRWFVGNVSATVFQSAFQEAAIVNAENKMLVVFLFCFVLGRMRICFILLFVLQQCNYCFGTEAASAGVRGEVTLDWINLRSICCLILQY